MPRNSALDLSISRAILAIAATLPAALDAQGPTNLVPTASLRVRQEQWNWFDPGANGQYGFTAVRLRTGLERQARDWGWKVEATVPMLIGLPNDAALPAPSGQLGLGATYFAASGPDRTVASIFVREATLRFGTPLGTPGARVVIGRQPFSDGAEWMPADPTLAAVTRSQVAERLVGPFGWTHVERGFDGVQGQWGRGAMGLTALAARATAGAFNVQGGPGLDVSLGYASLGMRHGGRLPHAGRLFVMHYRDGRGVAPVDNRPATVRNADREAIALTTMGGHLVATHATPLGAVDLLAWGVVQRGDWGRLAHESWATTLQAGWQPAGLPWRPWVRGGIVRTSGDDNPADGVHGTFMQGLPTPRPFARTPFYNMMNSREAFVSLRVMPRKTLAVEARANQVGLSESADLWYLGGGAFEGGSFGYAGRPSNGASLVGTLTDVSLDWTPHRQLGVSLYGGMIRGGEVVRAIYGGTDAAFGYLEFTVRR